MKSGLKDISIGIVSLGACAITEPDSGFPVGGSELQLYLLARKLAETEEFAPMLYVADVGQSEREEDGLRICPLISMGRDLRLTPGKGIAVVHRLARGGHDAYVTRSASGMNGLVFLASRLAGGRHLHMCASDLECEKRSEATLSATAKWFHELAMRRADVVACQTQRQLESLRKHYDREGIITPNLFPPAADPASTATRKGFLWVGRDIDCKQPELFVDLARRLLDERFTMVCQPQPDRDIRRFTKNAPDNLKFVPGLPFDEALALFSTHSAFVCTSSAEGFPNTFLQAAAAGMPILSLTVDPDGLIEKYGAGFVCEGSFDGLLSHTSELVNQGPIYEECSRGAFQWAEEQRTLGERTLEALRSLVSAERP